MMVRRQSGQALIFDGMPDGKMVKALKGVGFKTDQIMNFIVEIAPNTRSAQAVGFGPQVKDLADNPCFPKELTIALWCCFNHLM